MRGQQGQASVEWIGLVLLVALALATLTHLAPSADGHALAATVLHAVAPAAPHRQVVGIRSGKRNDSQPPKSRRSSVPLFVPRAGELGIGSRLRMPDGRALARRLRSGAGVGWRRAWLGCLAYERARYGFLHPDSRFPGHRIPPEELLRMANDCISPVDLVRDWPLVSGR